ncbi:MAG: cell division protein SepF [Nitriliruptoraceae bacterium]
MSPGVWNRTLSYLGLKEDPEQGYDELPEHFGPQGMAPESQPAERPRRNTTPISYDDGPDASIATVRSLRSSDVQASRPGTVPAADQAPMRTPVIEVLVFDDVEAIGARYRTGQPVLFDASKADNAIGRRVLDFVAGLTYVSRGNLSKVGNRAFLLTPEGVDLPSDERRRLEDLGYDFQAGRNA